MRRVFNTRHGGLAGVRDEGLLESARPNHPFLDGNKRTGFMLAATFLELNGMVFMATEESVIEATLGLAGGKLKPAAYAEWLRKNAKKG